MLKRAMFRWGQLCSRVFAVEFDLRTEPLYFTLSSNTQVLPHTHQQLFGDEGKLFSLHVHCDNRTEKARTHAEIKHKLSVTLSRDCDVFEASSFIPDVKNSVVKGFFIRDKSTTTLSEDMLKTLQQSKSVCVFSYKREGQYCWQELWSPVNQVEESVRQYITPAAAAEHHPSTLNIRNSDVFYCMKEAYEVLQECTDIIPESKEVLKLVDEQLETSRGDGFPVVVIEGLDATGKTTLTEALRESLNATLLKSPPQCLAPFRQRFDSEPPLIRRAFYALGNYITAAHIGKESLRAPVILDRYWHSTAAYAIATAVGGRVENLPKPGSELYQWPEDLLKPNLVLLLTVSPEERLRRLRGRGQDKTVEEAELEINQLFRLKVEEAYKRIQNPACIIVDASPSPQKVLQQVLHLIRNKMSLVNNQLPTQQDKKPCNPSIHH
ncbi:UMP-CMP kinase 2, mitochondrial-like [Sinocyclocheilus anshuiensis]|uniref:UMP-CMP kinase 2, mitochondrial n=1 Tax=Sinocyclocheilus anshuiensis TaxID=1608454 RepID=A0A671KD51_9TELE|nr:PREDICTED: UMP-CMP kinase 2, mitochondrial-like [Sinocyclocheilus anshuiensis]